MPDWEGPKRQKPPKQKSGRPDGPTVGMAVVMFLVVPAATLSGLAWFFLDAYEVI